MINEEEETWNKILDYLDTLDIHEGEYKQLEPFDLENAYPDFGKYFTDYCNIKYLEDIKESEYYLIKKWEMIFYQSIQLDDYFYHLDENDVIKEKNNKSNSFNQSKSKSKSGSQINLNINTNKSGSNLLISTSDIKEEINLSKDKNENKEKSNKELSEFKLKEAKKFLKIFECETVTGEEFESKCRRIFNAMLIIVQKDNYALNNPKKLEIQKFLSILKIQEFEKEKLTKLTNSDCFEIDIVINDFKAADLNKLKNNYASHFFCLDKLGDLNENENFNLIAEISRNFIFQIRNKYEQLKIYNAVLKIIEFLNDENCNINAEIKRNILSKFFLKPNKNKNIFLIITDGSYFIFRFVMSIIEKLRAREKNTISEIDKKKANESSIGLNKEGENNILEEKEQKIDIKKDEEIEEQNTIQEENINLNQGEYKYEWDLESDDEEKQKEIEYEIKEESVTDDMKNLIKDEIKKNKKLLEYLMAHKFRHLTYFIIKVYLALKYLEKNNIRYAILFIGDKENNKLENFFKEKKENNKLIKFETDLSFKIKSLISKLIESKDLISFEIRKFGNSIIEVLYQEDLVETIISNYNINNLLDCYKIKIKFYYMGDKIEIKEDENKNFVVDISQKKSEEDFIKAYNNVIKSKNSDSLFIFIDNKNKLKFNPNNKFALVKKEIEFPKIYAEMIEYIKLNKLLDNFKNLLKMTIEQKIKEFMKKKNIYNSKNILTLNILKEKLKSYAEFDIDIDKLVPNLKALCENIKINSEKYVKKLMKYKELFEKWMGKKFEKDFKKLIEDKFILLTENIKLSLIHDFMIKKVFPKLIMKSWRKKYIKV